MENMIEFLKTRRSIRKFQDRPVEEEKIEAMMKAALLAPSSKSSRPWHFVVVDDKEKLQKMAESREMGSQFLGGAPLAVLVLAEEKKSNVWVEDCSIASIIIQLAAQELGLGSCWVQMRCRKSADGASAEDNVRHLLDIPSHYAVLSVVAVGHKAREAKPFDEEKMQWEKVHIGKFGGQE